MILFLACVVGIIAGIITNYKSNYGEIWIIITSIILGIVGAIVGLTLIFCPIGTRGEIAEFESIQTSVEVARLIGEPLESATIQLKIIEANEWLASAQYYNGLFFFGDFIPNEVDNLEPIH